MCKACQTLMHYKKLVSVPPTFSPNLATPDNERSCYARVTRLRQDGTVSLASCNAGGLAVLVGATSNSCASSTGELIGVVDSDAGIESGSE
jgi:hypothetical protein